MSEDISECVVVDCGMYGTWFKSSKRRFDK